MSKLLPLMLPVVACGLLFAQDPPSRAGRISHITGTVSFQPNGVTDWVAAAVNRPLTIGDQVFADQGARAEIEIPGAEFRLGSKTAFQFLNLDDRSAQIRLSEGTLNVRVRATQGANVEIDTPNSSFSIAAPGEYRIDINPDNNQTYITARSGEGQVNGKGGTFTLHARQQAAIVGQDQDVKYQVYAAPGYDEFDNWAMSRNHRSDRRASSRYVSPSVVGYEDLDDNGDWRSYPDYGQVWVPRGMHAGWAPYQYGRWAWVEPWGWSWVDDAPWGFAPFHYGRWAHFGGGWGWVPCPVSAMPVYAPALVAWVGFGGGRGFSASFGIGAGSVGWFPLGPRDVYMPAYQASQSYVTRINTTNTTYINNTNITNIYNTYNHTGNIPMTNYSNRSVPGAMVAVPQSALSSARPVQQVVTRVQPNQVNAINVANPGPRVAPQVASVLGRPASVFSSAPHPTAAVLSRAVVARSTPPPTPPSFQQRQPALANNPGRPVPIQQQRQMAQAAPPTVHVMAQARPITPQVNNSPARPSVQQRQPATVQPQAGVRAPAPAPTAQAPRPFEPPSVQQRPGQPQPAPRAQSVPPPVQHPQPQLAPQPAARAQAPRQFEPPSVQQHPRQPQPAPRAQSVPPPVHLQAPPPAAARAQTPSPRAYQPPPVQRQAPVRAQAAPPQSRPAPPPVQRQARPAPPPPQQVHAQPAPRPSVPSREPPPPEHKPGPR